MNKGNYLKAFLTTSFAFALLANAGLAALNITAISNLTSNQTTWINAANGVDIQIHLNVTVGNATVAGYPLNITNLNMSINQTPAAASALSKWGVPNASISFVRWDSNAGNFSQQFVCTSTNSSTVAMISCGNATSASIGPTYAGTANKFHHLANFTIHFKADATGNYTLSINVTTNLTGTDPISDSLNLSFWVDLDAPRVAFTTLYNASAGHFNQSVTWPWNVSAEQNMTFNTSVGSLLNGTGMNESGVNISIPSANTTVLWYIVRNGSGENMTAFRLMNFTEGAYKNRTGNWSAGTNSSLNTSGLVEGVYNITLNATDEAGNWNTTEYRTFYLNRSENATDFFMWSVLKATQTTESVSFTVYTSANATCKYNVSGSQADFNGGVNMTTSGHMHTGGYTAGADGLITINVVCQNRYGVFNTTSFTITRDTSLPLPLLISGSQGASTLEGGTVSTVSAVAAGETGIAAINTPEVTTIDFVPTAAVSNVRFDVATLTAAPSTITQTVTGTVYKYIQVETQNLASTNIQSAFVNFKVQSSWLTTNNFDSATVKMSRWDATTSKWTQLTTTQTSNDATYYYFKAATPGFSIFAITAGLTAVPEENVTAPTNETTYTPPAGEEEKKTTAGMDWTLIGVGLAVVVIIAAAVFFLRPKKYPITGK